MKIILRSTLCSLFLIISAAAQISATGTPAFGSFTGGPDVTNLGNLNVHLAIPIFSKPGRGIPFSYTLTYDSSIWVPTGVSGSQTWLPADNWGWMGQTQVQTGYVSYITLTHRCLEDRNLWLTYNRYTITGYTDRNSVFHPAAFTLDPNPCLGSDGTGSATTTDGSGYTIYAQSDGDPPTATVNSRDGALINTPTTSAPAPGVLTDANGNQSSANGSGVFTDTLGTTALTITGTGTSQVVYTYTDSNGVAEQVKVNYQPFTVQTGFTTCGVSPYNKPNILLITSVVYPDNTSYAFTYEPTAGSGYVAGGAGSPPTTARLGQVTLPTGGTISYTYFNGSNGIVCSDGSTAAMHRTTTDGDTVYGRSPNSSTSWTTGITPPDGNETYINFQTYGNNFYQTSRANYAGSHNANIVTSSSWTCYNNTPCGSAITAPISEVTAYKFTANNYESETDSLFNSLGLPTDVYEYDFGASPNAVGPLLRHTATVYDSTLVAAGIMDHPASVTVSDGASPPHQMAQTTFTYDTGTPLTTTSGVPMHVAEGTARGNPTNVSTWLNTTGGSLTTNNWFDDTGQLIQTEDPGLHYTSFHYDDVWNPCGGAANPTNTNAFMTLAVNHLGQQSRTNYYPCTGQVASVRDANDIANGRLGTTASYDSMLRVNAIAFPDGGAGAITYTGANKVETTRSINSLLATDSQVFFDGYGRVTHSQTANGESSAWDQQDTSYDNMGRIQFVSYPYQGTATGSGDTYTYSFVGSPANMARATVSHADGTAAYTDVLSRATRVTDESGKQRVSMVDGLGRLSYLCEVSGNTAAGDTAGLCYLDIGASGFRTDYAHDALNNLTSIMQGGQTRNFTYDSLSRMLTATAPESGLTSYSYDPDGNVLSRTRPAPNQNGGATITTNYTYDALNRLTGVTYTDGTTPALVYAYDDTSRANAMGRMTFAAVGIANYSGDWFDYDSMGRISDEYQCTPNTRCLSSYYMPYTYDMLGNITSAANGIGITFSYRYNQASRLTTVGSSISDANHPGTLLSNIHYSASTMTDTLGNGIAETLALDARGRATSLTAGSSYSYALTYNGNSTAASSTDSINGNWQYGYNALGQLSSANKNTTDFYSYNYDRYGNRWSQAGPSGSSFSFTGNNTTNNNRIDGYCYDSAGNLLKPAPCPIDMTTVPYKYDAENRIITGDGGTTYYGYDALGRRIAKQSAYYAATSSAEYLYDLNGHNVTTLGAGPYEIYAGGRHLATYANNHTIFHHTDWLGSERRNTDETGTVQETCTGLPFGDGRSCTGPDYANALFTGDEHDAESNTEHTLFRQMSGTQGRWLSPDPYMGSMDIGNPQSMNRYAYVLNNPINATDPSGLVCSAEYGLGDTPCNPGNSGGGGGSGAFGQDSSITTWVQQQSTRVAGQNGEPDEWTYGYDITTFIFSDFGGAGGNGAGNNTAPCLAGAGPLLTGQSRCVANLEQKQRAALKDCVSKIYGVNMQTFVPITPNSNGYFYGFDSKGSLTIETSVSHSSVTLGLWVLPPGSPVAGKTPLSTSRNQINYVASDQLFMTPGLIQPTQVHELSHSLDLVTHGIRLSTREAESKANRLMQCILQ